MKKRNLPTDVMTWFLNFSVLFLLRFQLVPISLYSQVFPLSLSYDDWYVCMYVCVYGMYMCVKLCMCFRLCILYAYVHVPLHAFVSVCLCMCVGCYPGRSGYLLRQGTMYYLWCVLP